MGEEGRIAAERVINQVLVSLWHIATALVRSDQDLREILLLRFAFRIQAQVNAFIRADFKHQQVRGAAVVGRSNLLNRLPEFNDDPRRFLLHAFAGADIKRNPPPEIIFDLQLGSDKRVVMGILRDSGFVLVANDRLPLNRPARILTADHLGCDVLARQRL
ncbi:hypothetical protein D3C74_332440 [compost metagenome]